jgi:hypothetical protein
MRSGCDDEDINVLVTRINEFWRLRVSDDTLSDTALRVRLAEMADGIASDLDSEATFYRQRGEYLRSGG